MKYLIFILLSLSSLVNAQYFSQGDSLRGKLSEYRSSFDVVYYDLEFEEINFDDRSIKAKNAIYFKTLKEIGMMQLDLFKQLEIDSVIYNGESIHYKRVENAFFLYFNSPLKKGEIHNLTVYYHGKPITAKMAPWDGGFVWEKDKNGKPWVGTAVQGVGASLFWPCKDHLSDEPDSMRVTATVPNDLCFITNGNLEEKLELGGAKKYKWKISYPINNYNISLNIGDYFHFSDTYKSFDGEKLALDYYVLSYNLDKAEEQFDQVHDMLRIYEKYLGKYPFWEDGYALIETPYLGMEHQSGIAYGNQYKPGYRNVFYKGFEFDYIIIHETGHEYWGNSVSCNDLADMWIHESFCTYTEAIYVEEMYGYEKALEYMAQHKKKIQNDGPIQGKRDVNKSGSHDMYYKGAWMLHSMRHTIDNDSLWWSMLKGLAQEYEIANVDRKDIVEYFNKKSGMDLNPMFVQFLNVKEAPILEYEIIKENGVVTFNYHWKDSYEFFNMPVKIRIQKGEWMTIHPTNEWNELRFPAQVFKDFEFGEKFYYFKPQEKK